MHLYMDRVLPAVAMLSVPREVKRRWGRNPWKHLSSSYMNLGKPEELVRSALSAGFSDAKFRYLMTHGVAIVTAMK